MCEFEAVQVNAGRELPPGCVHSGGAFDKSIVAYVTIDHMPMAIRDGDWLVVEGERVRRVVSDKRFRELAVRTDGCGS